LISYDTLSVGFHLYPYLPYAFEVTGLPMGTHVGFTNRDRELVEALIKHMNLGRKDPLRPAAEEVNMDYQSARNRLYRLRNRYDKAVLFIKEYRGYEKKIKGRRYL